MLKNFLRILAAVAAASLLGYLFTRNIKIWEIEAVKKKPQSLKPDAKPKAAVKASSKSGSTSDKVNQINFDRIGMASADQKDDLKEVKGIGPAIEEKLNALGIYTFDQIANFTPEDEHQVAEAIEFFPGRIERDEWVKQAKVLKQQKYS